MQSKSILSILVLPLLVSAHFHITWPESRNPDDDDQEPNSPCGGYKQSIDRTQVSFPSFPVALEMEHDRSVVEINLALGNDPTTAANFNIALQRSFQQQGEGSFCLPMVTIPSGVDITNGMNATLQVITDGEGGGGLYSCADITFTSTRGPLPSACTNGTGITAMPLASSIPANQSTGDGMPQSGGGSASGSGSPSASATASGSGSSSSNQAAFLTAGWGVLGGAVIGAVALM